MAEKIPTVSIIVPMYNAEKFLNCCVNSILNQTFGDFELLLIDDCSTDNTLQIAKSFSDSRIRILRTEKNLGNPGIARNVGLNVARGKFFYFVDADDAILKNTLEILLSTITASKADIVYCSSWFEPRDPNFTKLVGQISASLRSTSDKQVSDDLKTRIWEELCQHGMHSVLWLCMYKREVFNGENKIRFPNYLAEDVFVHFDILCTGYKIVKINKPFYFYRMNPNSLTNSRKNIEQTINAIFALSNHIRNRLGALNFELKYINTVIFSVINGINAVMLLRALKENPDKLFTEIENACKKIFGDNANKVGMLYYNYLSVQNELIKRLNIKNEIQEVLDRYN